MSKSNFEYSEEIIEKMSDMLKPDIVSIMHNEVETALSKKELNDRFDRDELKKDLITRLCVSFLEKGTISDERQICGSTWSFLFNSVKDYIIMSVANMKTGVTFRYIVNSFDDNDLYDTLDYMRLLVERMKEVKAFRKENKDNPEYIKNKK